MDSKEQDRIMAMTRRNMERFMNNVQMLTDIYKQHANEPTAHIFSSADGVLTFGAVRGRLKDGLPVLVMRCPLCGELHSHAAVKPGFGENDHLLHGHYPDTRPRQGDSMPCNRLQQIEKMTHYRLKEVAHPRLAGL